MGKLSGAKTPWIKEKIAYYSKIFLFNQYLSSPIKALSKGNKQKVKIIASFLNPHCKYMLLDEPFDGLDPVMVEVVKGEYMKLKNTTIIISSHLMNVIDTMVEEFYIIKNGEIVDFKKMDTKKKIVRVNKELSMVSIKKLPYVSNISKNGNYIDITIDNIESFYKINKIITKLPKYKFSALNEEKYYRISA